MITITKQNDGVLFTFQDSDKYLYGNGTIEVPFNTLSIIADESDMITLKKAASNDVFLSARYDTDLGYRSKEEAVNSLKEILYDEAGISEEEVQQMIDAATSGIPSSEVIQQLRTDVNAISGDVSTLQDDVASKADSSALTAVNNVLTAHTANTTVHVTSAEKTYWNNKLDASAYTPTDLSNYYTKGQTDGLLDEKLDVTAYTPTDLSNYYTKQETNGVVNGAVSGKADTSVVNQAISEASQAILSVSGDVQTKLATSDFNAYSAATATAIDGKADKTGCIGSISINPTTFYSRLVTTNADGSGEQARGFFSKINGNDIATNYSFNTMDFQLVEKSAVTSAITSASTNSEVAGAKAVYDAIQAGGGGVTVDPTLNSGSTNPVANSAITTAIDGKQDALVYYSENTTNKSATITFENTDEGIISRLGVDDFGVNMGTSFTEQDGTDGSTMVQDAGINSYGGYTSLYYQQSVDDEPTTHSNLEVGENNIGLSVESDVDPMPYSHLNVSNGNISLEVMSDEDNITTFAVSNSAVTINDERVATEPYVDAATSGKADTSAVTAAIDAAKAYYISFATLATQGITDNDWNGIVAAIDAHRPIYAGYPRNDGGILYYGVECMNKNSDNTQIVLTASDNSSHYFYTFTKNGSNDYSYTVDTKPYVTDAEKTAWNAKVDTSAITTSITSGSTDSEIPTAKATYDAIQAGGGGGATYSAGYGINIDTANTISFNMPITCTTNTNDNITIGNGTNSGGWSMLIGNDIQNSGYGNIGLSVNDQASGGGSITGSRAILIGQHNSIYDSNPNYEGTSGIAIGSWNTSRKSGIVIGSNSTASGSSYVVIGNGATASGTTKTNINNQITVDTNNQVYIKDKTNTTDVCIQDAIAALGGLKFVQCTQAEYSAMEQAGTLDANTLYIVSNVVS